MNPSFIEVFGVSVFDSAKEINISIAHALKIFLFKLRAWFNIRLVIPFLCCILIIF